jgi:D-alanyl-D-alanine carboxypeptidase
LVIFGNSIFANSKEPQPQVKGASTDIILDGVNLSAILKPPTQVKKGEPNIQARNAILIDKDSAKVMYDKSSNEVVSIASTTKLTTLAVILDNPDLYNLNDEIIVKKETALVPGSTMGLKPNEKITIQKLLEGMLIVSGNDAARTLADHCGSVDKFVEMMNDKAKELGMTSSHYKDPAGYDDEGKSSARDLAIIAAYDLKFPKFLEIIKKTEYDLYSDDGLVKHHMKNSNRLVIPDEPLYYPYAIGVKTGFTLDAGHCLVSAAKKDGHTIIGVVLNTYSTTNDASARVSRELLSWGINNWSWD